MTRQRKARAKPPMGKIAIAPPYPPSWFDRFTTWVDRLPGPAWGFYVVLGIGVSVAGSAIERAPRAPTLQAPSTHWG